MTNILKFVGVAVVGLVIGYLVHGNAMLSGVYSQTNQSAPSNTIGDKTVFYKSGTIGPGANQGFYTNTTGQPVFIPAPSVNISYLSGTASSSLRFFVSTSTATSVTDYARPAANYLMIDAAVLATSTPANGSLITGTSTPAGRGGVVLLPGESLIFNVQSNNAVIGGPTICTDGACERATSTNRGIQAFLWSFQGIY